MVSRGATFIAPLPGTPPVGMSATDGRLSLGGIFGLTPQLVSGGAVTQSGSAMQFTLAQSVFQLGDVTNAAATAFLPTDSIVLTSAAGPGTGSRIDLICIPLKNYENGDGVSQSVPVIVAGLAGAPGVAPAVPTGSYKYAQILVPTSAATASVCTVTVFGNTTYAPPELTTTTLAKLNLTTGLPGQSATVNADTTNNGLYRWSGTAWVSIIPDSGIITPTLLSSWVAFGGAFKVPCYRLYGGVLYLMGSMKSGTTSATVFTLPVGSRPSAQLRFLTESATGGANIDITPLGAVSVSQYASGGSNAIVGLDGATFIAEQ